MEELLTSYYKLIYSLRVKDKTELDYLNLKLFFKTVFYLYGSKDMDPLSIKMKNGNNEAIWKIMEEFSILSFYIEMKSDGFIINNRLILSLNPLINKYQSIGNMPYYLSTLPNEAIVFKKKLDLPKILEGYVYMNFSLIKGDNGFMGIIRYTNYTIDLKRKSVV